MKIFESQPLQIMLKEFISLLKIPANNMEETMKLRILMVAIVSAVLFFITGILYAANGDLIVNGNLGVGTNAPQGKAEVNGNMIVDGNLGVGTSTPSQKLSVAGTIESTSGGIKFPDGTTQISAGIRKYIMLSDTKPQNTYGQTINAGVWNKRNVNTKEMDEGNDVSLSSDVITLQTGTYEAHLIVLTQPTYGSLIRLQNTSDSTTTLWGNTSAYMSGHVGCNEKHIVGKFTITSAKNFEIQEYAPVPHAMGPLGIAGVSERYLTAVFVKVSQ